MYKSGVFFTSAQEVGSKKIHELYERTFVEYNKILEHCQGLGNESSLFLLLNIMELKAFEEIYQLREDFCHDEKNQDPKQRHIENEIVWAVRHGEMELHEMYPILDEYNFTQKDIDRILDKIYDK